MKKLTAILLMCVLVMVGCGNSDSTGNQALDGDLKLESNQSLVIAQVTAIYGNEITLALAEKVDNTTASSNSKESSQNTSNADTSLGTDDASSNQDNSTGSDTSNNQANSSESDTSNNSGTQSDESAQSTEEIPSGGSAPSTGEIPTGDMPTGDMPSGDMPSGDMPSGGMPSDSTGSTDEASTSKESNSSDSTNNRSQTQVTRYTLTGEEMDATIPVGTPVTTLLGTVTTFSRIAVDNTLQIVTETNKDGNEVIVAIYIVG